jgi:hypothetical protein
MAAKLKVYNKDNLLWTFPDVSEGFILGYSYAMVFGNYNLENYQEYYTVSQIGDDPKSRNYYNSKQTIKRSAELSDIISDRDYEKYIVSNKYSKYLAQDGVYNYWLADDDFDHVYLVYDEDLEFYRGLSTGARDAGIALENVMLTWPLKDGQWYNIPELNLSYPDEI